MLSALGACGGGSPNNDATAQYTINTSAGTGGNITPINLTVTAGDTATFTITPDNGYQIAAVSGCNGTLNGNTYTTGIINTGCTVTATFESRTVIEYTVSTSAGTGGSITPTNLTVTAGDTAIFTITPDSGYQIAAVSGCNGTLNGNTYTTGIINADCIVIASFDDFTQAPLSAAEPALGYDIKTLVFTWSDVSDASYYRLYEDPDGISGFSQVGGDIAAGVQSYRHSVPLYRRLAARYYLQSCNSSGCVDSTITTLSSNLAEAIGYFKASNSETQDQFGIAVSLSADGSTLAVGAENEDSGDAGDPTDNTAPDSGAVYVYAHDGNAWQLQQYLKASAIVSGNFFGGDVSLSADGNTLAVAARGEDAVYLFSRSNGSWSQTNRLVADNPGADNFGVSIDLSSDGGTLAVGADFEASLSGDPADNTAAGTGAAYVFVNNGGWSQQAYLKAGNANQLDYFGRAVAISGDGNTVAVGAVGDDSNDAGDAGNNNGNDTGAVYIFSRSGSNWSPQAYIKAGNIDDDDQFGNALDLSDDGDTLAVGVQFEDRTAAVGGAVYVFSRNGTLWSEQGYLKATMAEAGDEFGKAVSLSANGNRLLVGAIGEDGSDNGIGGNEADNGASNAGAAYVFERSAGSWAQSAYLKASNISSNDENEFFGFAVSLSADGNTVAVGAKDEDHTANSMSAGNSVDNNAAVASGAVYLY